MSPRARRRPRCRSWWWPASRPCSNAAPSTLQAAGQQLALVKALARARLKVLSAQIAKLEAASAKTLAAEAVLAAQAARLVAVPGVGALTAATALALCPELGTLSRGQAAALLGVAPFDRDSGQLKGQRHIGGGRFRLRCALSRAALSAARANLSCAPFTCACAAGKPAKLALTAVMQKLFLLLNHLLKNPTFQLATSHSCFTAFRMTAWGCV